MIMSDYSLPGATEANASSGGALNAAGIANAAIGGLSMVGDLISGIGQGKKNREFAEKMYEKNKADTREFWNIQNQYNAPEAQMQRLKAAGLNPNLVYGSGIDAKSTNLNAPTPSVSNQEAPRFNPMMLQSGISSIYDIRIKDAQANLLREEAKTQSTVRDVNAATALLKQFESMSEETRAKIGQSTYNTAIETIKAQLQKLNADTQNTLVNTRSGIANIDKTKAETQSVIDENIRKWQSQPLNLVKMYEDINNTVAGTNERRANIGLIGANTANVKQNTVNAKIEEALKTFEKTAEGFGYKMSDTWFQQLVKGLFLSATNAPYDAYDQIKHATELIKQRKPIQKIKDKIKNFDWTKSSGDYYEK